ncbi:MAG: 30S ribosomal protein S7 [Nanoarchaeota archaeon]|nr:30S ribosomal protein S7 [Nanoarchaeota archaeon]
MEIKLFEKYSFEGVVVNDPGLKNVISLKPIYVPQNFGRHASQRFAKAKVNIVERLTKKLMTPGHKGKKHWRTSEYCTGKSQTVVNIVKKAFEIIEKQTKKNPIEILVRAIENAAPREEVTVIEIGGIRVPKQVDTAPLRRVDLALRWLTQGAFQAVADKKISIEKGLANEIIAASNDDPKSFAVSKRIEVERQAEASK